MKKVTGNRMYLKSINGRCQNFDVKIISTNEQLSAFEETNIKIYRCVKGDIDQYQGAVIINFQAQTNLMLGSSNTNYCLITFLCQEFCYYCQKRCKVAIILIHF